MANQPKSVKKQKTEPKTKAPDTTAGQTVPPPLPKEKAHTMETILVVALLGAVILPKLLRMIFLAMNGWATQKVLKSWDTPLSWTSRFRLPKWLSRLMPIVAAWVIFASVSASLDEARVQSAQAHPGLDGLITRGFIGLLSFVSLIVFFIVIWKTWRKGKKLGAAKFFPVEYEFARSKESVAALVVARPDKMAADSGFVAPIWPWQRRLMFLPWGVLARNILILGNAGSGKTTGIFAQLMLSARIPWIYQDQKADLPLREEHPGVPVWGLDTRGYETRSAVWNPMEEVQSAESAELIAAALCPDAGDQNDWIRKASRNILEGLIKVRHWASIQELAVFVETTPMEKVMELLPEGMRAAVEGDPKSRSYYQQHLLEVLKPWTTERIAEITQGRSTITLEDFAKKGGYLLANEGQPELRTPITLFWNLMFLKLRNRVDDREKLLILMDEMGDAGKIKDLQNQLALLRSKGVAICGGVQTEPLLKAVYGETWEAVRSGFGSTIFFPKNSDMKLRESWTKMLGNDTDRRGGGAHINTIFGFIPTGFSKAQEAATPLVPIDKWNDFAEGMAAVGMFTRPTWFVPKGIFFKPAPLGAKKAEVGDWRAAEAERMDRLRQKAMLGNLPDPDKDVIGQALEL